MSLDVGSLEGRVWLHELYLGSSNGGGEHAVRSIDANPFPMKANGSRLSATFGFTVTPPFEPSEPRLRAVLYAEDWDVSNAWGEDGFIHLDFYFNDYNCPSGPESTVYGMLELEVETPDGHRICYAQSA